MTSHHLSHICIRICIAGTLVFFAVPAYAAQMQVQIPAAIAVHETGVVHIVLDTEGESVNAVEGIVQLPVDIVSIEAIHSGSSFVSVWLEKPALRAPDQIVFSGITPGGFRGDSGALFTIVVRGGSEGIGQISLADVQVLRNDGEGTVVPTTVVDSTVSVSKTAAVHSMLVDIDKPEPFQITLNKSENAYDGRRILVYLAQDKGSGVAYYKVCEGLFAGCVLSSSPYVLKRQGADSLIRVQAVDHFGNSRTAYLFTREAVFRYALYLLVAILMCVGAGFILVRMRHT